MKKKDMKRRINELQSELHESLWYQSQVKAAGKELEIENMRMCRELDSLRAQHKRQRDTIVSQSLDIAVLTR